ncbi:alkaline phosphatase family protein [bacterium]|nr:alkaline phosphatase family protein [bacterium]
MKVIMIFIDGIGIGRDSAAYNPLSNRDLSIFRCSADRPGIIPENGILIPTDACLGVEGLPQSATGQTTLFTGINASKLLGRHLPGFPNRDLRNLLKEKSIFKQIKKNNRSGTFINTFRPIFFNLSEDQKYRLSVTTVAALAGGLYFYNLDDMRSGRSIYHDFTNIELIQRGFDVPEFSCSEAAEILCRESDKYDFTLYEYFLTDRAGHSRDMSQAEAIMKKLDRFIQNILNISDLSKATLIITSDHGNIEDLSIKTHTRNPALSMVWGEGAEYLRSRIKTLKDFTPAVIKLLEIKN